jgi:hypothetical protein
MRWLLLTAVLLPACLEYGSAADVKDILAAHGVYGVPMSCVNPTIDGQVVRAVACRTSLTRAQVEALTRGIPLVPAAPHLEDLDGACKGGQVLRGQNTKVANGAGPVQVHLLPAGRACVMIEYPWG